MSVHTSLRRDDHPVYVDPLDRIWVPPQVAAAALATKARDRLEQGRNMWWRRFLALLMVSTLLMMGVLIQQGRVRADKADSNRAILCALARPTTDTPEFVVNVYREECG